MTNDTGKTRQIKQRIDIRALTFVAAVVSTITAITVTVNQPRASLPAAHMTDRVDIHGAASADRQPSNLEIQLRGDGVSVSVPNCDMTGMDSRFFLHVYTADSKGGVSPEYLGRDFDLPAQAKRVNTKSGVACVADRAFDTPSAKEITIGQFATPDGRCCTILWSRNYVIGD